MNVAIRLINQVNEWIGKTVSWLTLVLVILYCYDVLTRYVFNFTRVWVGELEWHLYALVFLFGAAYTFKHDKHVRVDVFYQQFSEKKKAWINLLGVLFLLVPWTIVVLITSIEYAHTAFEQLEGSPNPGGLPFRFIIKSAITFGFLLLLLQGIVLMLEAIRTLFLNSKTQKSN